MLADLCLKKSILSSRIVNVYDFAPNFLPRRLNVLIIQCLVPLPGGSGRFGLKLGGRRGRESVFGAFFARKCAIACNA